MSDFDSLTSVFSRMALVAHGIIQPAAVKLFITLATIEIIWTGVQVLYLGLELGAAILTGIQLGLIGTLVRFSWQFGYGIINGFEVLGQAISGQHSLGPQAIYDLGRQLSEVMYQVPTMAGPIEQIKMDLFLWSGATIIDVVFILVGAIALTVYIFILFLLAALPIFLALGASSWLSDGMWASIDHLMWAGMLLLGFYIMIGGGLLFVGSLVSRMNAECAPVATAMTWVPGVFTSPSPIVAPICSNAMPETALWNYIAGALLYAVVACTIPFWLASIIVRVAHGSGSQMLAGLRSAARVGVALLS